MEYNINIKGLLGEGVIILSSSKPRQTTDRSSKVKEQQSDYETPERYEIIGGGPL
ncbi:hypothetical protein [Cohnella sp.]|uniref:hypothetical protein n=1 Tax=Cohnella sp. TaxID=1883426 RepID=UPI003567D867